MNEEKKSDTVKLYICEICGDAYIGEEKPKNCPFCGAKSNFIKKGQEAKPIFDQEGKISEVSRKNLMTTYDLEIKATAIYNCMSQKSQNYWQKAMYKRLAKVELEHAVIVTKLLNIDRSEIREENCSEDILENFKKTIKLEEDATILYKKFTQEAEEEKIKIFFTALAQVENDHIELIKNFI
jgi:rubrerythrin